MSIAALLASLGSKYQTDAAHFGSGNYTARGAALTGISNSGSGIFSAWVKFDGTGPAGTPLTMLLAHPTAGGASKISIRLNQISGTFRLSGVNASTTEVMLINSVNTYTSGTWIHVLASWDLANTGNAHGFYINDVSDSSDTTYTASSVLGYTGANDWLEGSIYGGGNYLYGDMADLYFAPGQYLDFSIESNRRKFISADGKPVYLGPDGSFPTGTAPIIYSHLNNGETVSDFANNLGTGGNFSITGTLTAASTSPSD